jgi:hypothetical protein
MVTKNFPQQVRKFEIQTYRRPRSLKDLRKNHIPSSGSPLKHPYDPKKVVIIPDPYRANPIYYEFKSSDISYMEELPKIVDLDGDTMNVVRIWVKKESVGVLCSPFLVGETET